MEAFLRFLTGDVWKAEFVQAPFAMPPVRLLRDTEPPLDATAVCLLSGGLDSFIGASDALAEDQRLYLVSVGSMGSAAHSTPAQDRVATALRARYRAERSRHLPFRVSPPRKQDRNQGGGHAAKPLPPLHGARRADRERLQWGRASPPGAPENGFITLNVPLSSSRLGTLSTRTTHPETIRLFRQILTSSGIGTPLELRYRFSTKGEMLDHAQDRDWVIGTAPQTVSCAHPTADRFQGGPIERHHCGHCLPCIIRRASMHHVGADQPREYRRNILTQPLDPKKRGADVRAARMAALRDPAKVGVVEVLHSAPCPPTPARSIVTWRSTGPASVSWRSSSTRVDPLAACLVDTHFHLDLFPDAAAVADRCEARQIYTIAVTNAPCVFEKTERMTRGRKYLRAALGLHPELAVERRGELPMFRMLLPRTRYVGEIGLDYCTPSASDRRIQRSVFEEILGYARRQGTRWSPCTVAGLRTMSWMRSAARSAGP